MKLLQNRLKQADFIRTVWAAQPEPGTTLKEMTEPDYWAHVSKSLKPGDIINVTPDGAEWFAELIVRSSGANATTVFVLRHVVFDQPAAPAADGALYEIKHRGGAGWGVLRKSDRAVMFEKGSTRQEAEEWVSKNLMV